MTQTPSNGEPGADQTPDFNIGDPVAPQAPDSSVPPPYTQPSFGGSAPAAGDTTFASMAHWLSILISFIGPLIIWLTKGEQDKFVKDHAVEALNFNITLIIGYVISYILVAVSFGLLFFLPFLVWVVGLIFQIQGAIAANSGKTYKYPFALRLVK
ncbi:DUF4870 domain-containing protein [Propionicimonas paludicola]|nr:DUF4870 domain-containing protein [Propionicimonas paludicola]